MKILISAYTCNPTKGGESANGYNWAYYNTLLGHEVWCITVINSKKYIEQYLANHHVPNLHFIYVDVADWVQRMYKYQPGVYLKYLIWQNNAARIAKELDKKIDFDVIHHVTWGSLQLGTAMWRLNKPLIFGPVGGGQTALTPFKKYFLHGWRQEITRKWISKLLLAINPNVRKTVRKAKIVLVTNQETYVMVKELGANNVSYFLDTSLPENFAPVAAPELPKSEILRILWVGRLIARKGLSLVLEALSKVKSGVPFRLTILGGGRLSEFVPGWIKEYKLEGKVDWKGQVPWEEVKQAYQTHDVFMFCSLRDSFASQFLEAMAYGLPIITLNIHGIKALVPDDVGIKAEAENPDDTLTQLAAAVEYMYQHPAERIAFGKKGYEFAKTQVWPIKIGLINTYYEKYSHSNFKV
ncbi:glycosyltransferase family 4 protein [Rhodocytophaga rosea]|uniref:Glycosyltransferase family 4 protein n=1 Tax=Rhodocytophaga rosea TaxID=2704465 RepID=A0A6C0GHC5_9BACT|nr:glycosyltransferase family 4 protein [Rhodocytophaga rosea]QHT67123.1 glycosyltransferase family 4 protein [Rhodocytophaga rosea]